MRNRSSLRSFWKATQIMTITRFFPAWRPLWIAFWSLMGQRASLNQLLGDATLLRTISFHQLKVFLWSKISMDKMRFVLIQSQTRGGIRNSKLRRRSTSIRTRKFRPTSLNFFHWAESKKVMLKTCRDWVDPKAWKTIQKLSRRRIGLVWRPTLCLMTSTSAL